MGCSMHVFGVVQERAVFSTEGDTPKEGRERRFPRTERRKETGGAKKDALGFLLAHDHVVG